jgi:hypothetical protein
MPSKESEGGGDELGRFSPTLGPLGSQQARMPLLFLIRAQAPETEVLSDSGTNDTRLMTGVVQSVTRAETATDKDHVRPVNSGQETRNCL